MADDRYKDKRDFTITPEPQGTSVHNTQRAFVVHKHAARRLHYDLRLQLDGVLKSWAVPKGPSTSPLDKRLAVEVEDHPLEYRTFEGVIPPGQYGAGRVDIWDNGEWEPIGDPRKSLRDGLLKFYLRGTKLIGQWTLVRMKKKKPTDKENWLLIKERDPVKVPVAEKTFKSDRQKKEVLTSKSEGVAARMPTDISPQLAQKTDTVPEGENWLYEIKYDGYRIIAYRNKKEVRLLSRNAKDWTKTFPAIANAILTLPVETAIFDGEICIVEKNGVTSFQDLQNSLSFGNIKNLPLVYFAFDMLYKNGYDLRNLPLIKRKTILRQSLENSDGVIRFADQIEAKEAKDATIGSTCFETACSMGLEGIIAKDGTAPYTSGRKPLWQKIKCGHRQEMVIGGFTKPQGSRTGFGALLLGYHDGATHELVYAGKTGTGFTDASLGKIHAQLLALVVKKSPFAQPVGERGVTWVRPELVCEVAFAQWTDEGKLRHASFLGLRKDKNAADIVKEESLNTEEKQTEKPAKGTAVVGGVTISHSSKVLERFSRMTKFDLAHYMNDLSDDLLRFAANRPLALVRCPEGTGKTCFFQKHKTKGVPPSEIKSITDSDEELLYIASKAGFIELAQFNVIEIHSWCSQIETIEFPDEIVLDLDPPPGMLWKTIVQSARVVRDLLEEFELVSFVKTTGGNGLHVVVPLLPQSSWDTVQNVTHAISLELQKRDPKRFTTNLSKAARGGKIFVDYLRNVRGATAIAPYSPRIRKNATVAMPVAWDDLDVITTLDFTVRSVPGLIKRRGAGDDPWRSFEQSRKTLPLRTKF